MKLHWYMIASVLVLATLGCDDAPPPTPPPAPVPIGKVIIKHDIEVNWNRVYIVRISDSVTMTITAMINPYRYLIEGERDYTGELDQAKDGRPEYDRKWVLFDPRDPADKILDKSILAKVQEESTHILAYDLQWWHQPHDEVVDKDGVHWKKVK